MKALFEDVHHANAMMVDGELMLALEPAGELPLELPGALHVELTHLLDRADRYSRAARSVSTTRAYRSDWRRFEAWLLVMAWRVSRQVRPPSRHLTSLADAGRSVSTIRRRFAAIGRAHRIAGHASPTADPTAMTVLENIARVHGAAPREKTGF